MSELLTFERFHPFIRCVGMARHLCQTCLHKAYDHRMIAVIEGSGEIETENATIRTDKGEIVIIPPGTAYRVVTGEKQKIVVINFDMTHAHSCLLSPVVSVPEEIFEQDKIIESFDLSLFFDGQGIVKKEVSQECISLSLAMLDAYKNKRGGLDSIYLCGLFSQLVFHMVQDTPKNRINRNAKEIYRYISDNFRQPLTLESVAEHFHFHPTYVNRLIKKYYGTTVVKQLLKCRFDRALYLIDNTDMAVKDIAQEVGFRDAHYFSKAFYDRFGCYPTSFRK